MVSPVRVRVSPSLKYLQIRAFSAGVRRVRCRAKWSRLRVGIDLDLLTPTERRDLANALPGAAGTVAAAAAAISAGIAGHAAAATLAGAAFVALLG